MKCADSSGFPFLQGMKTRQGRADGRQGHQLHLSHPPQSPRAAFGASTLRRPPENRAPAAMSRPRGVPGGVEAAGLLGVPDPAAARPARRQGPAAGPDGAAQRSAAGARRGSEV